MDEVGGSIEKMREEMQKTVETAVVKGGGVPGAGGSSLPNPAEFDSMLSPSAEERGDDYYAALEQQRQVELMNEQDEQLDGVFRTVGNLRQQADDMGRELEDQNAMITEVDSLADRVGGKLNNGMAKMKYIIRKNEGKLLLQTFISQKSKNKGTIYQLIAFMYNRHYVLLLYRTPDFRARSIINSFDCVVICIRRFMRHPWNTRGWVLRPWSFCEDATLRHLHHLPPLPLLRHRSQRNLRQSRTIALLESACFRLKFHWAWRTNHSISRHWARDPRQEQ